MSADVASSLLALVLLLAVAFAWIARADGWREAVVVVGGSVAVLLVVAVLVVVSVVLVEASGWFA